MKFRETENRMLIVMAEEKGTGSWGLTGAELKLEKMQRVLGVGDGGRLWGWFHNTKCM